MNGLQRKKKVALVTTLMPETHYSRYLLSELQKDDNYDVLIFSDKNAENKNAGLKNIGLVYSPSILFPFQIALEALKKKAGIVHLQHEMNMYGGAKSSLLFPLLPFILRLMGKKVVITFHAVVPKNDVDAEFLRTFNFPKSKFLAGLVKLVFLYLYRVSGLFADRIIVHSQTFKKSLAEDYNLEKGKIEVVPIGIDKVKTKNTKEKDIILYFGYLLRRKGIEFLIEAFSDFVKKNPKFKLVISGGILDYQKDYAEELKALVSKKGMNDKIIFTGFISQKEIEDLYRQCKFIVLPYINSISSSMPLSFAWQFEKPAIGTKVGSLMDEITDSKDGLLVQPKNAEELRVAMEKLIKDKKLYKKLKEGVKIKLEERSWANVAKKTLEIYRK